MGWRYWQQPDLAEEVKLYLTPDIPVCYHDIYETGNPDALANRRIYDLKHGTEPLKVSEAVRAADNICDLLRGIDEPFVLTWIPGSTALTDPENDLRLQTIATSVSSRLPACHAVETLVNTVTRERLHESSQARFPAKVSENWKRTDVDIRSFSRVYVLDDVVTTGASMAAAFRMLRWMVSPWTLITGLALTAAVKKRNLAELKVS